VYNLILRLLDPRDARLEASFSATLGVVGVRGGVIPDVADPAELVSRLLVPEPIPDKRPWLVSIEDLAMLKLPRPPRFLSREMADEKELVVPSDMVSDGARVEAR
jgi:hypothetical protein